jgi:hypothetical protein
MNKTLTITTIALVAVVMGMSAVAPMIPMVEADKGDTSSPDRCRVLEDKLNSADLDERTIEFILEKAGCRSSDPGPEV